MPRTYLSFGGNLGAVADTFSRALDRLADVPGNVVGAVSPYVETRPVGNRAGTGFLNAAAEVDTQLSPFDLLDLLQSIEQDLGRTRSVRWGPRTLDLDLLFYGAEIIDVPRLVVPHPAAWYRRFVLDPLVEIVPGFMHPEKQVTVATLRQRLLRRPLVASFAGGVTETRSALIRAIEPSFPEATLQHWHGPLKEGNVLQDEPALIFWLGPRPDQQELPVESYRQLPRLARIDTTTIEEPVEDFVTYVLQSALG